MITIEIIYKSNKLEKLCNSLKEAKLQLGEKAGKKLIQRNSELKAFKNLDSVPTSLPFRREKLKGKESQWSVRIDQQWRIIMTPNEYNNDLRLIDSIIILEVSNHYDK